MAQIQLTIADTPDDANEKSGGAVDIGKTEISAGSYQAYLHAGLRFVDSSLMALHGSTIDSVTLAFKAAGTDSGLFTGTWYCQDAASPLPFSPLSAYNISDEAQRPRTTASVVVDEEDWSAGPPYEWLAGTAYTRSFDNGTSSLVDLVQEIADSYYPTALVFLWIYGSGSGERVWQAYGAATPAVLTIIYTAGAAQQRTPEIAVLRLAIPTTRLSISQTLTHDAAVLSLSVPTAALSQFLYADPAELTLSVPTAEVSISSILTPAIAVMRLLCPTAVRISGGTTKTAGVAEIRLWAPTASLQTVPTGITYATFGHITRLINSSDYPSGAVFAVEAVVKVGALETIYVRLYNITDGAAVSSSLVTSTATDWDRIRTSPTFSLDAQDDEYRIEFGSTAGTLCYCKSADVVVSWT